MTVKQVVSPKANVEPLFQPFKFGKWQLENRMVYPPLTRMRGTLDGVPQPHMATYYDQRATKGSLFIAEATYVSPESVGYARAPGIYNSTQVEAWKPIVKAVHDKGAVFFSQLIHCGRAAHSALLPEGKQPLAPSAVAIGPNFKVYSADFQPLDYQVPHALTKEEIKEVVGQFRASAKNAIEAGFDGVELHGANGYLLEQFIKSGPNKRTDEYGGSIEKRCRFMLEVVDAVVAEVGADRVGVRLSPFSDFLDSVDETPYATYMYLVEQLNKRKVLYLHMIEARIAVSENDTAPGKLDPFRAVFEGAFIAAGGYTAATGSEAVASGHADLIAYGRWWLANPDLPKRFKLGASLNKYDRNTFYSPGMEGYLDYPLLEDVPQQADVPQQS